MNCGSEGEISNLAQSLKQEKLFVDSERQQIQSLNERVVRAFEEVFQNSWVRAEQRRNYQELLSPDSSPAVCCRNANILNSLSFIPSYKILGSNDALYGALITGLRDQPEMLGKLLVLGDTHAPHLTKNIVHTIFSSVYASCILPQDHRNVLLLLRELMREQVCASTNPLRLLRNSSSCAFNLLYKAYIDTLPQAKVFLTAALHQPLLQLLVEDDLFLDIDASKAALRFPPQVRQRKFGEEGTPGYDAALAKYKTFVTHRLAEITNRFVCQLSSSMQCFPPTLLWLVRSLYHLLMSSPYAPPDGGGQRQGEVTACCVDLVVVQLLCSALVTPEVHGVCDAPVSHIARYNLMQIGELLQMLAMARCEATVDGRLSGLKDLLSSVEMEEVVSSILDGPCPESPPMAPEGTVAEGLVREVCLVPHCHLTQLLHFLHITKEHLPDEERAPSSLS